MAEANIKASLSVETVDALKKIVEIKQQLKEVTALLSDVEKGKSFNSEDAKNYGLQIEKLNIALKDATEEFGKASEKTSKFESFKEVLSGIQGGFGAITGTLSLFGEKSEVVEKALEKVKTGLEITEGIESINKAVTAFKALGLSIAETGIGALAISIIALIAYFKDLNEEVDEAAKKQKLYDNVLDKTKDVFVEAKVSVADMQQQLTFVKDGVENQQVALDNFNNGLGKVLGTANSFNEVLKIMSDKDRVQAYVEAMKQRAIANEAFTRAAKNEVDIEIAQQKIIELEKSRPAPVKAYGRSYAANNIPNQKINEEIAKLKDGADELTKQNNNLLQIQESANKKFEEATKAHHLNTLNEDKKFHQSQSQYQEQSQSQQLTVQLEVINSQEQAQLNIENAIGGSEENIYNIQKQYQQLRLQALEQYYINIKDKNTKHAQEILTQITNVVKEGVHLDEKHIKVIFDAADAEIKKNFENFKPSAEVAPPAPESDEEKRRRGRLAQDSEVKEKLSKRQEKFDIDQSKDKTQSPYKKELSDLESFYAESKKMVIKKGDTDLKLEKYYSDAKRRLKKEEFDYELQLTEDLLNQASNLFGKNTAAGKVTAIAAATINTYLGATKALATLPPPFSYVSAALTIATGIKNIQSIINTQVPGQSSSGSSVPSMPSSPVSPQVQQTNTTLNQEQLNQIGNATVRAFVLESDVSNNQEKIARLNRAARLGG